MRVRSRPARPNIVLIVIDTLRADHLSCYGYPRQTSPWLDRIADTGVVYDNAMSAAAWTPPSHASIFTGAYPSRHGVDRSHLVLGPDLIPLPEALRRHGYRTFGVSSNYWLSRETRFDRGFDHFVHSWQLVQTRGNARLERQHQKDGISLAASLDGWEQGHGWLHTCGGMVNSLYERSTRSLRRSLHLYDDGAWRVNSVVGGWMREWKRLDTPFFAFVHYMEPHLRYAPPGRYRKLHVPRSVDERRLARVNQDSYRYLTGRAPMGEEDFAILRGLYDGEISYVDARVGQLCAALRDQGLLDNTLLVITSDHGENLGEHGLMDHVYCVYDTLLHVPLIIAGPSDFPRGHRVTEVTQTPDLFPTMLTLAGIRDEDVWSQVQSQPLFPAEVRGHDDRLGIAEYLEPQPPMGALRRRYPEADVSRFDRTLRTVRAGRYKYIWASDGKDELYDLAADPGEERNLVATEAVRVAELRASLDKWLASFTHSASTEDVELDSLTRKRLEDLGYLS
ncbi:MAG TPA: sulfatase [Methylomirabilota bacterium]|jgi:arylsulfatase A-like enzyme|nr:sulfatase [Methylomirabilota bacterium]